MNRTCYTWMIVLFCMCIASLAWGADHLDPPDRVNADTASSDIADLYAWHQGSGNDRSLVIVVTYGGPLASGSAITFDPNVLYTIHLDNTGNNQPDQSIYVRFAQNIAGDWGVQVINLPGATGPVVGAANTTIDMGNTKIFTGLRDDPFFFDLGGFTDTLATGTLSFDPTRDFFAGSNVYSIVLEMPLQAALGVGNSLNVWATTARISE